MVAIANDYDALGRQTAQTDPRTGSSSVAYNALGQVSSVTDAASNATSYAYELATGRKSSETDALGDTTLYAYNSRGQITAIRGTAQYPVDYVYDSYGRMTQLLTYRDSSLSAADATTWAYHEPSGLLSSKTDANAKSVSYTYGVDGKLASRTWARGVVTSYAYDLAGDLTGITYSDSTPAVGFTYDRLGQQLTVTDAVGSRTFTYNGTLQLTSEAVTGIYNKTISRSYDTLGRRSGMSIGIEYAVGYGYDDMGRFSTVTNGNDTFAYSYLANSNLISTITYPSAISVTKSYEGNRDLVTSIENKHGSATISKYDYSNDGLGRRTAMGKSGSAFTQADTIAYGYNDRSEVTSALAQNQAAYNYGFSYDPIGNRIASTTSETGTPVTRNYTSNQLNQYTAIDNPSATPAYDDDGNMTSCPLPSGVWSFTWDGENRLARAVNGSTVIDYKYDYGWGRVEKKITEGGTVTKLERYVYNDYLQLEQLNGLDGNAVEKKRIWGVEDKIIADIDATSTFYALGDENKNITEYLDGSGTIQAHYEFSPFGEVAVASGSNPDAFEFRFSSEYFDTESGLVYYNFRYLYPELGRWLTRDPIEEKGGKNLYNMVDNNLVNNFDVLGNYKAGDRKTKHKEGTKNSMKSISRHETIDCNCFLIEEIYDIEIKYDYTFYIVYIDIDLSGPVASAAGIIAGLAMEEGIRRGGGIPPGPGRGAAILTGVGIAIAGETIEFIVSKANIKVTVPSIEKTEGGETYKFLSDTPKSTRKHFVHSGECTGAE